MTGGRGSSEVERSQCAEGPEFKFRLGHNVSPGIFGAQRKLLTCENVELPQRHLNYVLCLKFVKEFQVGGFVCNWGRFKVKNCWLDYRVAR